MSTVVAQVRVLPVPPGDTSGIIRRTDVPYFSGRDPVTGAHFAWTGDATERLLDESVLAQLQADPCLEVRVLDARSQAAKRAEIAFAMDAEAKKAEAHAATLRTRADAMMLEAQTALDSLGPEPAPVEKPKPYTEQLLAALPDNVRDEVERQKISMATVREQMQKSTVQLASEHAAAKPHGALAEARAQAAGEKPKSKK